MNPDRRLKNEKRVVITTEVSCQKAAIVTMIIISNMAEYGCLESRVVNAMRSRFLFK